MTSTMERSIRYLLGYRASSMMAKRDEEGKDGGGESAKSSPSSTSNEGNRLELTDNVGPLLGHVNEISSRSVGELDGVDGSLRSDDIGDVRDGGSRGGSEVEDLLSGGDVDLVETSEDTSGKLGSERVPDSVLGLGLHTILSGGGDGDSLGGGKRRGGRKEGREGRREKGQLERKVEL